MKQKSEGIGLVVGRVQRIEEEAANASLKVTIDYCCSVHDVIVVVVVVVFVVNEEAANASLKVKILLLLPHSWRLCIVINVVVVVVVVVEEEAANASLKVTIDYCCSIHDGCSLFFIH